MLGHCRLLFMTLTLCGLPAAAVAHIIDAPDDEGPAGGTAPAASGSTAAPAALSAPAPTPKPLPTSTNGAAASGAPGATSAPASVPGDSKGTPAGGSGGKPGTNADRGAFAIAGDPVPVAARNSDPAERLTGLAAAYAQMLAALDPDLRTRTGRAPGPEARTRYFKEKLSDAEGVLDALEVHRRLEASAAGANGAEAPAPAELDRAAQVLLTAIHEIRDDVPAEVAGPLMRDPRRNMFLWLLGGAVLGGVTVVAVRRYRPASAA